jgi:hypothetical protein
VGAPKLNAPSWHNGLPQGTSPVLFAGISLIRSFRVTRTERIEHYAVRADSPAPFFRALVVSSTKFTLSREPTLSSNQPEASVNSDGCDYHRPRFAPASPWTWRRLPLRRFPLPPRFAWWPMSYDPTY